MLAVERQVLRADAARRRPPRHDLVGLGVNLQEVALLRGALKRAKMMRALNDIAMTKPQRCQPSGELPTTCIGFLPAPVGKAGDYRRAAWMNGCRPLQEIDGRERLEVRALGSSAISVDNCTNPIPFLCGY